MLPEKKLKIHTFKPKKKTRTIFIGGLVRVDAEPGTPPGPIPGPIFHVISSEKVTVHEISSEKVTVHETKPETATDKWESWLGTFLFPPCSRQKLHDYEWESVKLRLFTGQEVAIKGLGWINVARGPLEITITHPVNTKPVVRNGLVGPLKFKK